MLIYQRVSPMKKSSRFHAAGCPGECSSFRAVARAPARGSKGQQGMWLDSSFLWLPTSHFPSKKDQSPGRFMGFASKDQSLGRFMGFSSSWLLWMEVADFTVHFWFVPRWDWDGSISRRLWSTGLDLGRTWWKSNGSVAPSVCSMFQLICKSGTATAASMPGILLQFHTTCYNSAAPKFSTCFEKGDHKFASLILNRFEYLNTDVLDTVSWSKRSNVKAQDSNQAEFCDG